MAEIDIRRHLERQYQASLAMLGQAIALCSDSLWTSAKYTNPFWHVAYHAIFYTHLYLHSSEAVFRPWESHKAGYQFLGPRPWPPHETTKIESPYTKAEVLEYHGVCCAEVEARVPTLVLDTPSGFEWLPFDKFELQLYNIRHIQHHTGQLADRLRTESNVGLKWVVPG
jgi:hypothetical protein